MIRQARIIPHLISRLKGGEESPRCVTIAKRSGSGVWRWGLKDMGERVWVSRVGVLASWGSRARVRAGLLAIILLAFALRLYRLGYQSLWYDEAVSVHLATKDLTALTLHTAGDIHPPLYYYLLHFWVLIAGSSEFSAAFFSVVFGILILVLAYRLAHEIYGGRAALLAAFLIAISPFNLWYSQEVRMYTLGAFLGLLTLYCLLRLVGLTGQAGSLLARETLSGGRAAGWRFWVGYILAAAVGLYTLYYFAFLLLFENLFVLAWWLWHRCSGREEPLPLGRWALAQFLVVVLYLPWLPIALRQALYPPVPPWRGFSGLATVITESWAALSLGQSVEPESLLIWPVLSFMFAVYLLGVTGAARRVRDWPRALLLCGYTFAPVFAIYLLSLRIPLFHVRYVFTYSPPFYILLAVGLMRLGRRWRAALPMAAGIITVACGYSIYMFHSSPLYAADDHRDAVNYIEERMAPGDAVLINAGYAYPPFLYYFDGEVAWRGRLVDYQPDEVMGQGVVLLQTGTIGGDERLGWGDPASDFYATTEIETAEALERVFAQHPRVWVYRIYDTVTDPQGFIRSWLDDHGRLIGDEGFHGESYMRVQCYLTATEPEYDATPVYRSLEIDAIPGLELVAYEAPAMVRQGEELPLTLSWRSDRELDAGLDLRLSLALEEGLRVAEVESALPPATPGWEPGELLSQEVGLQVPSGTPPLEYDLVLEWSESSQEPGPWSPEEGLTMGTITVLRPLIPLPTPPMPHEPWANFGDLLQLTGYELPALDLEAGDELRVTLLWRAWDVPLPVIISTLELRDTEGRAVAQEERGLGGAYTSILWGREELVREVCGLQVSEGSSPGTYTLALTLQAVRADGKRELLPFWSDAGVWEDSFALGTLEVIEAHRP
jgi:4-amino-4-deoxy-L-arabinose transferase-like glycosyltransferase